MNHENHPHYPEEYKIWEVEFFGKKFFVTPDVLIPRLETEALVRRARKFLQNPENQKNKNFLRIFDIGSGSGIIGTSLTDLGEEIIFIDISKNALKIAEKNFLRNFSDFSEISGMNFWKKFTKNHEDEKIFTKKHENHEKNIHFIYSDLLENIDFTKFFEWKNQEFKWKILQNQEFGGDENFLKNSENEKIFIVSNLPYIKNDDWENMSEDTIFEPKLALFGGEKTGFELYEKLFFQIQNLGLSGVAMIEFGFDQREIAENFFKNNFPNWKVEFFADFAGIERFAEIEF